MDFLDLPDDIIEKCITSLPLASVPKIASCSKFLCNLTYSESVWKHFYILESGTEDLGSTETYHEGCRLGTWRSLIGRIYSFYWADVSNVDECTFDDRLIPHAETRSYPYDAVPAERYSYNGIPTLEFRGKGGWKQVHWRIVLHRILPSMWLSVGKVDPTILEWCKNGDILALQVMRAGLDNVWFRGLFTCRSTQAQIGESFSQIPIRYPDMTEKYGGTYHKAGSLPQEREWQTLNGFWKLGDLLFDPVGRKNIPKQH